MVPLLVDLLRRKYSLMDIAIARECAIVLGNVSMRWPRHVVRSLHLRGAAIELFTRRLFADIDDEHVEVHARRACNAISQCAYKP